MADQPDVEIAGFLSLEEPTKAMREAGALAGQYEYKGIMYNRIQFLTVKDILEGKREFHTPTNLGSRIVEVDVKVAQELLRHANSRITMDVYPRAVSAESGAQVACM